MTVTITSDSAEAVALGLMQEVLQAQAKVTGDHVSTGKTPEQELFSLYVRCVNVVRYGSADEPPPCDQGGYVATMIE